MKTMNKKEFFDECNITSDILEHLIIWKEWEPIIRKALRKSAEDLLQTPEYKGVSNIDEIEPEEALMNIISTYMEIPQMIKQEAEKRAKKKMKKYWLQYKKLIDEFTSGKRCLGCGKLLEKGHLSDMCGKCLEEM